MVFRPTTKNEKKEFKKAAKEWADGKSEAVEKKYGHISTWDTSEITDMSKLFKDKHKFNDDISNWDVSNVTNMEEMFWGAKAFNHPIGDWNVSKVTSMFNMFCNAKAFNQPIGEWNVSKVTSMFYMFERAKAFNNGQTNNEGNAPLKWNVSAVRNMMYMFNDAYAFNQDISSWDVSNVEHMQGMFYDARAFNQSIENWDVSKVSTYEIETMFKHSGYKQNKPSIELSIQRNREKQTLMNIAIEQGIKRPTTKEEYETQKVLGQAERNQQKKVVGLTGTTRLIDSYLGGKRKTKKRKTEKRKTKKQTRKRT